MKSAPKTIHLNLGCDNCDGSEAWEEFTDVTWSKESTHESDVQYVRSDFVLELAKQHWMKMSQQKLISDLKNGMIDIGVWKKEKTTSEAVINSLAQKVRDIQVYNPNLDDERYCQILQRCIQVMNDELREFKTETDGK